MRKGTGGYLPVPHGDGSFAPPNEWVLPPIGEMLSPLPANPRRWDAEWRYILDERESIMLESNVENARYLAVIDARKVYVQCMREETVAHA